MKHNYYIVTFYNNMTVFASCMNEEEAEILSKAIMIKNGLSREIKSIVKINDLNRREQTDFVA